MTISSLVLVIMILIIYSCFDGSVAQGVIQTERPPQHPDKRSEREQGCHWGMEPHCSGQDRLRPL